MKTSTFYLNLILQMQINGRLEGQRKEKYITNI
jgi:hypothetical protein